MRDMDNNWSNSNMDYETDSDSDSDIDDYNYDSNKNNWSNLTGDKINRQTDRHNNSFLEMINKKLESLEDTERSTKCTRVERKNDNFLDLYERMKTFNSSLKHERKFEPHHRSPLTRTMTNSRKDGLIDNDNNSLKISTATDTAISIKHIDKEMDFQKQKATDRIVDRKTNPIEERITRIEEKNLRNERSAIDIIDKDKKDKGIESSKMC